MLTFVYQLNVYNLFELTKIYILVEKMGSGTKSGGCRGCITRIPYATLIALIMCWAGVCQTPVLMTYTSPCVLYLSLCPIPVLVSYTYPSVLYLSYFPLLFLVSYTCPSVLHVSWCFKSSSLHVSNLSFIYSI